MSIPGIELKDGYRIPQVGLGLWQMTDSRSFETAVLAAFDAGYKHFDTAQFYRNEGFLGSALKHTNIPRDQVFITSKIQLSNFGYKRSLASIDTSLKNLKTDYIDLMLLHFPVSILRKKSWLALEDAKKNGVVRSIGVSNYTIRHLEEMKQYATEMPVVNQVELHVFLQQSKLIKYCHKEGIVIEAYSPLAHAKSMDNEIINRLATKYNKSYAQIMLRWAVQKNLVVLPKSVNADRIRENANIFDFVLTQADIELISTLDRELRTCWDPTHVP